MIPKERRGVYLLPNLFTTASLFAGFYAIIASIQADWEKAVIAILVAGVMDSLDGRIARLIGAVSAFGVQYDSLSDLIAFGVAPAILVFTYALKPFGRWGWLAAFFYLACGTLRLARFNIQVKKTDMRFFTGLPIPAAAMTIALFVINSLRWHLPFRATCYSLLVLTYILSLFMISTLRYYSFKDIEFVRYRPFRLAVLLVLTLVLIMSHPFFILWCLIMIYVCSGPVYLAFYLLRRRRKEEVQKINVLGG